MAVPHKLISEALALPSNQREELLRALLASLDEPGQDDGHVAAWDAEIDRRVRDDEHGSDDIIADGRDALRRLRADIIGP